MLGSDVLPIRVRPGRSAGRGLRHYQKVAVQETELYTRAFVLREKLPPHYAHQTGITRPR